jgi:hypothetical protein
VEESLTLQVKTVNLHGSPGAPAGTGGGGGHQSSQLQVQALQKPGSQRHLHAVQESVLSVGSEN